jgi:PAS domain S-box-containing protein
MRTTIPERVSTVHDNYASLFEFSPIGAYRSSPDGQQLRANPALVRLNGYASEAEMLAGVRDIATEWYVDPQRRGQFKALLERDGFVRDFVSEVWRHKTRERIWIREHAHVVHDESGAVRFYEGMVEEITQDVLAREALRRSEEQLRTITAQVPGAIFRLHLGPDGKRRFDFISPGAHEIFGVDPAALMADADLLLSYIHPDDLARFAEVTSAAQRDGAPIVMELRATPPTGGERWVQLTSSAIPSTEPGIARIGVVVDITERKLADKLRAERDHAETAHRMSTQFLSRVSHELRTPLNAVLGFAQLLELGQATEPQRARWVHEILVSGRHLLAMVDDVLDLAGAQSGQQQLKIEPVDVLEALSQVRTMLAGQAREAGILLETAGVDAAPARARADARRLRQVLSNLLSNAIKYNRPGGRVDVGVTQTADSVEITVADTGIGMSTDQLARLYHPFERLGAQNLDIPGTGLGLSLSKQLVDAMGGTIKVRSAPDAGSVFMVRLPAS